MDRLRALACFRPNAFASFIRLLGPFHFVIGITLLVAAWNNGLSPKRFPSVGPDIVFCFLASTLIQLPLMFTRKADGDRNDG